MSVPFPLKNGEFKRPLPYDHLKNLAECYIVTYLEVDAPYEILQNAIRIWCDHIFISHNFIQIDDIVKGVRMSGLFAKSERFSWRADF